MFDMPRQLAIRDYSNLSPYPYPLLLGYLCMTEKRWEGRGQASSGSIEGMAEMKGDLLK
jgi:hypothetical protein